MNILEARRRTLGKGVYKKTVEGNPAIAQGSLARMYPGITMQGWTEQNGTPTPETPVPIVSAGTQNQDAGKYQYEVKLTGKNLWNAEEAAETSKWVASTSQSGYSDFAIDVSTGKSITVSFPEKLPTGLGYYVGIVLEKNGPIRQWVYHSSAEGLIFQQATVVSTGNKIWIRCVTFAISDFVSDNPLFQIEYGEERTDFQPYKEQTVTLTSDRPLTKWDRLEKRNGQWGWVYKSEEIESYTDESVPGEYFSTTGQLSTGAQVWYETTTETFVPLSESEQEQMNALHTFRPTTVLSNDCGCNMTLTYKTKKSLEVTD